MNDVCEIALRSSSGPRRESDALEARTTVTAPIIAMRIPKRSICDIVTSCDLFFPFNDGSYLAKMFVKQEGCKEAVGNESELEFGIQSRNIRTRLVNAAYSPKRSHYGGWRKSIRDEISHFTDIHEKES